MPNRLAQETSPYLLQHANNPVAWWPWGPEALARSRAEERPIFLSIGYSACHWCHVMEHESFENEEIAQYLNEHFVCIKVDREERPDLDQVYMNAVQVMTGRGGWPMSVFLTPDLKPFFGGTYWPPHDGRGMPGFDRILRAVADAWQNRRAEAIAQAGELTEHLKQIGAEAKGDSIPGEPLLQTAESALLRAFDRTHGGFGSAPKFPHPMHLQFLLRTWRRSPRPEVLDVVKLGLDKMSRGGIYDHLGGGFARYSVDERWLVPHFEKMLYDNALLLGAYLDGYLATGEPRYAKVARETIEYLLRDLCDPRGAFHSTEDADSEGEEGKFYVWNPAELRAVLGEKVAERFAYVYDVTDGGNFEHRQSILNLHKPLEQSAALKGWNLAELEIELADARAKLLAVRSQRVRPGKDDKILANWNGLAIDSLARAAGILDEPRYAQAAVRAATFICDHMRRPDGRLYHAWRSGRARFDAYLDDYAALANAFVSLYEATLDERWIDEAVRLADILLAHFRDKDGGGFFFTSDDHEQLITRQKDLHDSSTPSGSALAAQVLTRLARLCGRADYDCAARETFDAAAAIMERQPLAAGSMLLAFDLHLGPVHELVLLGDPKHADTQTVLSALRHTYLPHHVLACRGQNDHDGSPEIDPIFQDKVLRRASPALFICENFTCHTPANGPEACVKAIEGLAKTRKAE